MVRKSSQPSFKPAKSRRRTTMKPYKSLFLLAVEQLGERKNRLSDLRVLSGLCWLMIWLRLISKGDPQSQDANGKGRYDVPPVSGGKTRNFWPHFFTPWKPQRVTQHGKTSTTTLDPTKNGGWKIPSGSYLFLLPKQCIQKYWAISCVLCPWHSLTLAKSRKNLIWLEL